MVGATVAAVMVMVSVCVAVPPPLVAVIVAAKVPVLVTDGVPEITPVLTLTVRPRGKPVALKLVGELVAVIE